MVGLAIRLFGRTCVEPALAAPVERWSIVVPFSNSVVPLVGIRSFAPPPYDGFAFVTGTYSAGLEAPP